MGDRLAELRDTVTADYEDMRRLFERLRDADLDRRSANGWSLGQLAGHVAMRDGDIFVLDRLRKGKNSDVPAPLRPLVSAAVNISNWSSGRRFRQTDRASLLRALEDQHNLYFAYINDLGEDELDFGGNVFRRGRFTVYEYVKQSGDHMREHAVELRASSDGAPSTNDVAAEV